ncbi:MAG: hypothetical protein MJ069_00930, partial [Salinivirgaceae bacterium]|nr:hypothetical protein [Salinivirgaceae bacterium]
PDTKKQFEKRNGKEKRRYKKQEVTARLCAKEVFTPANAEQWQTDYLRCWLQAAKTVKASRYVPTKRKGRGM